MVVIQEVVVLGGESLWIQITNPCDFACSESRFQTKHNGENILDNSNILITMSNVWYTMTTYCSGYPCALAENYSWAKDTREKNYSRNLYVDTPAQQGKTI